MVTPSILIAVGRVRRFVQRARQESDTKPRQVTVIGLQRQTGPTRHFDLRRFLDRLRRQPSVCVIPVVEKRTSRKQRIR